MANWPEEIERLVRDGRVSGSEIERVQRANEHEAKAVALGAEAAARRRRGLRLLASGRRRPANANPGGAR